METKEQEEEIITLMIQAHGFSLTNTLISVEESAHCELLSFTGSVGKSGLMRRNCPELVIPPQESYGIPEIPLEGPQLDVMATSYVQQVYTHINQNPAIDTNIKSNMSFDIVANGIPEVYSNCGISRFPYSNKNIKTQIHDIPFTVIDGLQDKEYQIYPNAHEDCSNRQECKSNGYCTLADKSEQFCPYYGIYVVHSTNEEDNQHTLSGKHAQNKNEIYANLNSEESEYTGKKFWRDKINNRWENIIRDEVNEEKKAELIKERDRIIELYNKMTRTLESSTPTSDKIIADELLPEIKLSEILQIFRNGMGYDKVNIIDPSCDSCQKFSKFKLVANIALRDVRRDRVRRFKWKRGLRTLKRKRGLTTREGRPIIMVRGGKRKSRKMKTRRVKKCKRRTYKR